MRLLVIIYIMGICEAQWIWTPETGWINARYDPRASAQAIHEQALKLMEQRAYGEAVPLLLSIVKEFPNTPEGKDSLYLLAECLNATGNYYEAYIYYEEYRLKYLATPRMQEVLEKEYEIGRTLVIGRGFLFSIPIENHKYLEQNQVPEDLRQAFQQTGYVLSQELTLKTEIKDEWIVEDKSNGETYIIVNEKNAFNVYRKDKGQEILGFIASDSGDLGVKILQKLIEISPYADFADDAQLTIGNYYFRKAEYVEAETAYLLLIEKYPKSEWGPFAQYQMAMCSLLQYEGPSYDREPLLVAEKEVAEFFQKYKDAGESELGQKAEMLSAQIRDKKAKKDLEIAIYYLDQGNIPSAKIYLYSILKEYKNTPTAREAEKILQSLEGEGGS